MNELDPTVKAILAVLARWAVTAVFSWLSAQHMTNDSQEAFVQLWSDRILLAAPVVAAGIWGLYSKWHSRKVINTLGSPGLDVTEREAKAMIKEGFGASALASPQ